MIQNLKMIYSIIALSKFYGKDVPKCYTYLGDFSIPFEIFLFSAEIALWASIDWLGIQNSNSGKNN